MDIHEQISKKIQDLSQGNKIRDKSREEADRKMEEGYKSEPVVEQVLPKKKEIKSVSVQRKPETEERSTSDMAKDEEQEEAANERAEKDNFKAGSNLAKSLDSFDKILNENTGRRRDTVFIEKEDIENKDSSPEDKPEVKPAPNPKNEEAIGEPPERAVKTTIKENPRHKGLHTVKRRRAHPTGAEENQPGDAPVFCLYEPLTGSLNELIRDETVIGKSDRAHIMIKNQFVSRIHARVSRVEDRWYIEDLGSLNGTKVNDEKVKPGEKVELNAGDNITLAATKIIFDQK